VKDVIVVNKVYKNKDIVPKIILENHRILQFPLGEPVRCSHSEATQAKHGYNRLDVYEVDQYLEQNKDAGRLLILRSQGIGDILLLTPALRELAKRYREIHVGVREDLKYILKNNPDVTKIWTHDIDGKNSDWNREGYLQVEDLNYWSEVHSKDRASKHRATIFADKLCVDLTDKEPYLALDTETVSDAKRLLPREEGQKYIGIQCVASHSYRDYPYMEDVVYKLADAGFKCVLLCHFKRFDHPKLLDHKNVINLQGRCGLRETCGVIDRLDAMVAADSGLMHVALALGIPTVAMFGICSSRFRVPGYKPHCEIMERKDLRCIGCGDWSMSSCRKPNDIDGECMKFPPDEVVARVNKLPERTIPAKVVRSKPKAAPVALKSIRPKGKLWMAMMFQDEPKEQMERFADEVISHPSIEKVIAVNGGAQNGSLDVLKKIGKVEVHGIPYQKGFFNMQAHQRNASFSFVPDGMPAFFMDPDEAFGGDMAAWLADFPNMGVDFAHIARATWDTQDEARRSDYRPPGSHDWPDYQPRFYKWRHHFKFHGGAHHVTLGCPAPRTVPLNVYILHYEEESGHRQDREALWAGQMAEKKARVG
jgi:ADP-heptose:LPS heptosyltransferase